MPPEKLLEIGLVIAGLVGTWAVMKYKLDSHSRQIEKLWDWKDKHEEEAGKERLLLHQNISKLEGLLEFRGRENIEIREKIDKITNTLEQMREDLAYLKANNKHKEN